MPRNTRTVVARRRQQVLDLKLKGYTQAAIAETLGVVQSTVSKDLARVHAQLRDKTDEDARLLVQKELQRIELVERAAWEGFERSRQPAQSAVMTGDEGHGKTRRSVKHQHGDPRFLTVIQQCGASRRQLLGIDAPTKLAATSPEGPVSYAEMARMIDQLDEQDFATLEAAQQLWRRAGGTDAH